MKILFVCTGNTCRSPMAAAIAKQKLSQAGRDDIQVDSAGLAVFGADPAASNAIEAMAEMGVDLKHHRSRALRFDELPSTDWFVAMTPSHAAALSSAGVSPDRIYVLNVPDPFGGSLKVYRQSRDQISTAVDRFLKEVLSCD